MDLPNNWERLYLLAAVCYRNLGANCYCHANLLQVALMRRWKKIKHPVYQMFQKNPFAFLELQGELINGKLCSVIRNKPGKTDWKVCDYDYTLLNSMIKEQIRTNSPFKKNRNSQIWTMDDDPVKKVYAGLKSLVDNILADAPCIYPKLDTLSKIYEIGSKIVCFSPTSKNIKRVHFSFKYKELRKFMKKTETLLYSERNKSGEKYFPYCGDDERSDYSFDSDEPDVEFAVDEIVAKRVRNGNWEYLVKWKDFSSKLNSWVKEANLDCEELLNKYNLQ